MHLRYALHNAVAAPHGFRRALTEDLAPGFLHQSGEHVYGAAGLFFLAVGLLGAALFRFGHEVWMGVSEADHYR
jgi:hypothetical protein